MPGLPDADVNITVICEARHIGGKMKNFSPKLEDMEEEEEEEEEENLDVKNTITENKDQ